MGAMHFAKNVERGWVCGSKKHGPRAPFASRAPFALHAPLTLSSSLYKIPSPFLSYFSYFLYLHNVVTENTHHTNAFPREACMEIVQ